uniref:Uncharacterized protein n=1 Tax=Onchocerca volvulus TaxID=6282 RepID=A0A2K6W034_ONCVO
MYKENNNNDESSDNDHIDIIWENTPQNKNGNVNFSVGGQNEKMDNEINNNDNLNVNHNVDHQRKMTSKKNKRCVIFYIGDEDEK